MGELDDLARTLREGAGRELRDEAALDEVLTELQRRRRLDMADIALRAMHRGDRVTARVAGLSLTYSVTSVGSDYLTMTTDDGGADVRLDVTVLEVRARPAGGASHRADSATFRARLAEHEQNQAAVVIRTVDGIEVAGTVEVVAADHLVIRSDDGVASYIPIQRVAVVFSPVRARRG